MSRWTIWRLPMAGKGATMVKVADEETRTRAARRRNELRAESSDLYVMYRDNEFVNSCQGKSQK